MVDAWPDKPSLLSVVTHPGKLPGRKERERKSYYFREREERVEEKEREKSISVVPRFRVRTETHNDELYVVKQLPEVSLRLHHIFPLRWKEGYTLPSRMRAPMINVARGRGLSRAGELVTWLNCSYRLIIIVGAIKQEKKNISRFKTMLFFFFSPVSDAFG